MTNRLRKPEEAFLFIGVFANVRCRIRINVWLYSHTMNRLEKQIAMINVALQHHARFQLQNPVDTLRMQ